LKLKTRLEREVGIGSGPVELSDPFFAHCGVVVKEISKESTVELMVDATYFGVALFSLAVGGESVWATRWNGKELLP